MERDAVTRDAVLVLVLLDFHAVRVVGTHFVERKNVQEHQRHQHQRNRHHVQGEELVHRGGGQQVVAAHPGGEGVTDLLGVLGVDERQDVERNRAGQGDDHLGAPVGHVAPGQHVAEETFRHQGHVDQHAEDPHQLAGRLVGAVQQAAEHMQVDHGEEGGRAHRVHVADQPAPLHVAHDELDGLEALAGGVEHGQPDAGEQLVDQHHHGQHAKVVPEIEVLRSVVLRHVLLIRVDDGETRIHPVDQTVHHSHHALVSPSSEPTITTDSLR